MGKDHSVREDTRCRHCMGYSFRLAAVVEQWLKQEIAQWVLHEGSIRRHIAPCTIEAVMNPINGGS